MSSKLAILNYHCINLKSYFPYANFKNASEQVWNNLESWTNKMTQIHKIGKIVKKVHKFINSETDEQPQPHFKLSTDVNGTVELLREYKDSHKIFPCVLL